MCLWLNVNFMCSSYSWLEKKKIVPKETPKAPPVIKDLSSKIAQFRPADLPVLRDSEAVPKPRENSVASIWEGLSLDDGSTGRSSYARGAPDPARIDIRNVLRETLCER